MASYCYTSVRPRGTIMARFPFLNEGTHQGLPPRFNSQDTALHLLQLKTLDDVFPTNEGT